MALIEPVLHIIQETLFYQLAAMLFVAGVLGVAAIKLRQPLIVAFIGTGLLAGPSGLDLMPQDSSGAIETLANLGIALLLFMVGLKLDLGLIRTLGPVATIAGLAQVVLTALLGGSIALALGMPPVPALCVSVALTFSSTIIVVKTLSDLKAIDSLYGRICLGILIIQDIAVILAMIALSGFASGRPEDVSAGMELLFLILKVGGLIAATAIIVRFFEAPISLALGRSGELMVIFALGFAAALAGISYHLGLSKELGGLLAGIALASTPLRDILLARLTPLRDFLLLFFFAWLGAQIDLSGAAGQIGNALILSLFVLLVKPLIIMSITGALGYRKRTSFMAGVTLSQISEFSLIFAALAVTTGFVEEDVIALISLVALITIALSTYGIMYGAQLYDFFAPFLHIFERKNPSSLEDMIQDARARREYDVVIFGLGRYGAAMAAEFRRRNIRVLGIDFDPQAIRHAQKLGIPAIYGDASNADIAKTLPVENVHTIVCAFPHYEAGPTQTDMRRVLAQGLRAQGYKGYIAVAVHEHEMPQGMELDGINMVLTPYEDAAEFAASHILNIPRNDPVFARHRAAEMAGEQEE